MLAHTLVFLPLIAILLVILVVEVIGVHHLLPFRLRRGWRIRWGLAVHPLVLLPLQNVIT